MKKYILALALVCIVTGLLAQDQADNIQGTIYIWSETLHQYVPAAYEDVNLTLKYNDGSIFETVTVQTTGLGHYTHNFTDRYHNHEYCNQINVTFRLLSITEPYDGIVRIDIEYGPDLPVPDPEPNNE